LKKRKKGVKIKKIRIKSREDANRDLRSIARDLDQGRVPKTAKKGEFFESLDAIRSILTDKRLELWRTIRDQKPTSISSLAAIAGRDFRVVYRDVKLLETLGLVSLKKMKGERGDLQHPVSLADELVLAVA
jgi:predicted transcriptional regulator